MNGLNRPDLASRMLAGFARVGNKQANGSLLEFSPELEYDYNRPAAACALGALALGYGLKPRDILESGNEWWWPESEATVTISECPHDGCRVFASRVHEHDLEHLIPHLNDAHHWTVEQIAEWLGGKDNTQA